MKQRRAKAHEAHARGKSKQGGEVQEATSGHRGASPSKPTKSVRFGPSSEAPAAAREDKNAAFFSMMEAERLVPRGFSSTLGAEGGGNGFGGMPPEEGDSDPEDAEIRYLERQLGLAGGESKSSKKQERQLRKEYRMDGLGEGFFDFLTACDQLASATSKARRQQEAAAEPGQGATEGVSVLSAMPDVEEGVGDLHYAMQALSSDEDGEEEEGEDSEGDSVEGGGDRAEESDEAASDSDGSAEAGEFADAKSRRRANFADLFGDAGPRDSHEELGVQAGPSGGGAALPEFSTAAPSAGTASSADSAGAGSKYVPPSMRRALAAAGAGPGKAGNVAALLDRKVQGLLNRVAASNVEGVLKEVCGLPAWGPDGGVGVGALNEALVRVILQLCADDVQVMRGIIMVYAALLAGAHIQLGVRVGAKACEAVVLRLQAAAGLPSSADEPAEAPAPGREKEAVNLTLLLSYMYIFGVVTSGLVLDVLHLAAERLGELDVTLLATSLRHCGFQLRSDDGAGLKALLDKLHSVAEAGSDVSTRVRVMADLVTDIRNNRKRQTTQQLEERGVPLRKWLSRLASSSGASPERRLRVRWHDIMDIPSKGRWWLVGSSWAGHGDAGGSRAVRPDAAPHQASAAAVQDPQEALLLKVARKMHMNTDVKRRVFVALMGAGDPQDAVSRLLALDLRGAADRDIVRVLVDCAGQEKAFNPYYAAVGVQLCRVKHAFKFTFQLALWDNIKGAGSMTTRRVYNLARLQAALIKGQALSLAALKVFDFARLDAKRLLWLRATVDALLAECESAEQVAALFGRCGTGRDVMLIRDGMTLFLSKYMKAHIALTYESDADMAKVMRLRLKTAKRALDAVRPPSDVDDSYF